MKRFAPVLCVLGFLCLTVGCVTDQGSSYPGTYTVNPTAVDGDVPCSESIDIKGPSAVGEVVDGACEEFAQALEVDAAGLSFALADTTVRVMDGAGADAAPCGGSPGCAREHDRGLDAYVAGEQWQQVLAGLIHRILLARVRPDVSTAEHDATLRRMGLCSVGSGCEGFPAPVRR